MCDRYNDQPLLNYQTRTKRNKQMSLSVFLILNSSINQMRGSQTITARLMSHRVIYFSECSNFPGDDLQRYFNSIYCCKSRDAE